MTGWLLLGLIVWNDQLAREEEGKKGQVCKLTAGKNGSEGTRVIKKGKRTKLSKLGCCIQPDKLLLARIL